jgi:hypothetical protein
MFTDEPKVLSPLPGGNGKVRSTIRPSALPPCRDTIRHAMVTICWAGGYSTHVLAVDNSTPSFFSRGIGRRARPMPVAAAKMRVY